MLKARDIKDESILPVLLKFWNTQYSTYVMFVSFKHSRHSSVQDGKARLYLVEKRLEILKYRNIRFFALQHHVKVVYGLYMNTT
jgi:hypothetical protein